LRCQYTHPILLFLRLKINHATSCNYCAFIIVLGVDVKSLFLIGKPGQQTGQAEPGLAKEDADKK
jgi:hypothetical protein